MPRERIIIAFECIDEKDDFLFESEFFARLRRIAGDLPVLHLDTFSDSTLLGYAKKAIDDGSDTLLLVQNETSQNLQGLSVLLTAAARSNHVHVLSATTHPILDKLSSSEVWENLNEEVQKWILNPSESF
jgi:hypothetical protein